MAIKFRCPHCDRMMQAPEDLVGRDARCPSCQNVVQVPRESEEQPHSPLSSLPRMSAPPEGESTEGRRPCPMCGEMIMADAVKCRFCGEIFDPELRRSAADPALEEKCHKQMNALGALWIVFSVLGLLGYFALSNAPRELVPEEMLVVVGLVVLCWFLFGLFTCLKHIWAVYAGLVISYLNVVGSLFNLSQTAGERGGAMCGAVGVMILMIVGIVQGHRIIGMHGRLKRMR